jgi:hypothetical protein
VTDPRTEVPDRDRLVALWTGLLLAPAAFLANLEFGYLAVRLGCVGDTVVPLHLIHAVCLLAAAGGGLVAWRIWQATGAGWPGAGGEGSDRTRFMAALGLAVSVLFGVAIVAQWIPTFTLHPCQ